MTGRSASIRLTRSSSANPSIPDRRTSVTRTPRNPGVTAGSASSAEAKARTVRPASSSAWALPKRTDGSSSTKRTTAGSDIGRLPDNDRTQADDERRAGQSRACLGAQRPAEAADDVVRDRQPESESEPLLLGRVERLEQVAARRIAQADAVVVHLDLDRLGALP